MQAGLVGRSCDLALAGESCARVEWVEPHSFEDDPIHEGG